MVPHGSEFGIEAVINTPKKSSIETDHQVDAVGN
jgi:hypothetical protein